MSETALTVLGVLELAGLVGMFLLIRWSARRKEAAAMPPQAGSPHTGAGLPRLPRPARIALALGGLLVVVAFPVLMVVSIVSPSVEHERLHEQLVARGTRATAVITGVEETGTVINKRPLVRVRVSVDPAGAPAFASQWTRVFTVSDVQTYQVGAKVNVAYDPADHGAVAVVGLAPPRP